MIKFVKVKDIEDIEYELAVKPISVATGRVLLGTVTRIMEEARLNTNMSDGISVLMNVFTSVESEKEDNELNKQLLNVLPTLVNFFYDEILLILCDLVSFRLEEEDGKSKLININMEFFEKLPIDEIYPLIEGVLAVNSIEKITKLIKNFSSLLKLKVGQKAEEIK